MKGREEEIAHLYRCRSSNALNCIDRTSTLLTATASVVASCFTVSLATIARAEPYLPALTLASDKKSLQEKASVAW